MASFWFFLRVHLALSAKVSPAQLQSKNPHPDCVNKGPRGILCFVSVLLFADSASAMNDVGPKQRFYQTVLTGRLV